MDLSDSGIGTCLTVGKWMTSIAGIVSENISTFEYSSPQKPCSLILLAHVFLHTEKYRFPAFLC